ncbi:MAG: 50S ribosomal protein L38e [Candidatus Thorarchaeota archaeon]
MPIQIQTVNEFKEIIKKATEVRMKRSKENKVKMKARTNNYLYTYICEPKEADLLWRDIKITKNEIK